MPHIVINMVEGRTPEVKQDLAKSIQDIVTEKLGGESVRKYVSVSVQEVPADGWPDVYDTYIKGKDNVLAKPGYTNPLTFE